MNQALIALLLFTVLTGCNDTHEPLEVIVPKTVTTKVVEQKRDNDLYIRLASDGSILYRMGNESDSAARVLQNPSVDDIKTMISGVKEKVVKNGKSLSLILVAGSDAEYPKFKQVIDAMKSLELYKFSMITAPASEESK